MVCYLQTLLYHLYFNTEYFIWSSATFSNVLLTQSVFFMHICLCIYVHICAGIYTPAYDQIQCVIYLYPYISIYTYKVTAISQVFLLCLFLEQFHFLYDNEETSLL